MEVIQLAADDWLERAAALKAEGWWATSLAGVDRLGLGGRGMASAGPQDGNAARYEIVAHLIHHDKKEYMRVHVAAAGEPPTLPSVTSVWPVTNFQEREAYDMYGIHFEGHPNLTRILMPDEWEGWPLRKDYGVGKVPIEFVPQPFLQVDAPGQSPSFEEAGRAVDDLGQPAGSSRHRGNEPSEDKEQ